MKENVYDTMYWGNRKWFIILQLVNNDSSIQFLIYFATGLSANSYSIYDSYVIREPLSGT